MQYYKNDLIFFMLWNRFPSNMFNINTLTGMMYWLYDAGQVLITLFQGTSQTISDLSCDTVSVCVASRYLLSSAPVKG